VWMQLWQEIRVLQIGTLPLSQKTPEKEWVCSGEKCTGRVGRNTTGNLHGYSQTMLVSRMSYLLNSFWRMSCFCDHSYLAEFQGITIFKGWLKTKLPRPAIRPYYTTPGLSACVTSLKEFRTPWRDPLLPVYEPHGHIYPGAFAVMVRERQPPHT
jgi:hypothetical protein